MENKRLVSIIVLSATVLALISGCGKDDSLIGSELMMIEENEYVSSEVAIGDLKKVIKKDAEAYYPITSDISSSKSGVVLERVVVDTFDYVKEGDLLAEVRPYTDEEIAELEKAIATKEQELNTTLSYFNKLASEYNSLKAASSNATEKAMYDYKLEENRLNMEYSRDTSQSEIDKLKKELEVIKAADGDCNIYAPFEGVIDSIYISSQGTVLSDSTPVFSMYSTETIVVYFEDPGYAYFNNDVTVYAGLEGDKQEIKGKVVGADHYLHPDLCQGKIFVRLEGDYDKENLEHLSVEMTTYNVQNVLVTKSSGVNSLKDKDFVYILEDGKLKKRHVKAGGSGGENTWILQGVDEGDVIYLQ